MKDPTPDLPDDTEIENVQLPMIIGVVLKRAGIRTVGEVRKTPDANLRWYPRFGRGRVAYLRKTLGSPFGLSSLGSKAKKCRTNRSVSTGFGSGTALLAMAVIAWIVILTDL